MKGLLLLLSMAVFGFEAKLHITIYIPSRKLTWYDARQYCQDKYLDIVNWETIDPDLLTKFLQEENLDDVWIGLHKDPHQLSVLNGLNVKTGEDLTGDGVSDSNYLAYGASCSSYNSITKTLKSILCITELPFVCYADNLVVVNEHKTWEDALSHCRELTTASSKYDLLSIASSSDYGYLSDRINGATTEEVWMGLRFLGGEWWWSDGETLDPQGTLQDCPSQWEHCGTISKYNTAKWLTRDCSERRNFVCSYEEVAEQVK
ncbi:macrophage mannose receptor 1-like [Fundulus heteroclitus]|uniref:macrophage mannose receptor 1-like n=1 Tax=Fundulus heteroclitus TaxID=8078 RepID=UPI00165CA616|nr:macrophage mannose receptor 1-like [Fundulus heteroclitus]